MHDISIISLIFTAALVLSCLFLILSPLFKWDSYLQFNSKGQDLAGTKESLLSTLNELEFEYKMDKMSHADYKSLKRQYEEQVAVIMKEEEQLIDTHVDEDLMAEVEKEIEAQMKSYKGKKGEGK
ncbi:MAG TPA: hypothetical protein VGI04_13210 [Neobacillus sp.]|jgi:hypothetical protein